MNDQKSQGSLEINISEFQRDLENKLADVQRDLEGKIAEVRVALADLQGRMGVWGVVFVVLWALSAAILGFLLKGALG